MRLDRLGWAWVIYRETLALSFEGLSRYFDSRRMKHHHLIETMLHDDRFMDAQHEEEVKYRCESGDEDGYWEEHVKRAVHDEGCCPHENPDEYQAAFEKMFRDEYAKKQWMAEHIDWDWIRDNVIESANDVEGIACHLKKHPVEAVYDHESGDWIPVEDIVGYCFECDRALLRPHCEVCNHDNNDMTGVSRPFNWPPGGPLPSAAHPCRGAARRSPLGGLNEYLRRHAQDGPGAAEHRVAGARGSPRQLLLPPGG